tara:strand:- start:263 stop:460 length:198 start_codon:yes stop_codon:yes gene_type:complete
MLPPICGTKKRRNIIVPDVASKNFWPIELNKKFEFFISNFLFSSLRALYLKPNASLIKHLKLNKL